MTSFTVTQGKSVQTYNYPDSYKKVTLKQFIASLDVEKKKPKLLRKYENCTDEKERAELHKELVPIYNSEVVPYWLNYVAFWTGMDVETVANIGAVNIDGEALDLPENWEWVLSFYDVIKQGLNESLEGIEDTPSMIQYKDDVYYLPKKFMQSSTVAEYFDACQVELNCDRLSKDQFHAIPELLNIILKKKDQTYEETQDRPKDFFEDMNMDSVFRVSFFLSKLSLKLGNDLAIYTGIEQMASLLLKSKQVVRS